MGSAAIVIVIRPVEGPRGSATEFCGQVGSVPGRRAWVCLRCSLNSLQALCVRDAAKIDQRRKRPSCRYFSREFHGSLSSMRSA
jgi:hypothetical protein